MSIDGPITDYLRRQNMFGTQVVPGGIWTRCNIDLLTIRGDPYESILMQRLSKAIKSLPARHQKVLQMKYFEDLSQRKIAKILRVHETRITHIHANAIQRLQQFIKRGFKI
jgi:RNA polymerase sigma factor (sigma-70 family)